MSIQSEITRITNRRDQSFQQVAAKGVTVPAGSTIDDLPNLIAQISTGGGSAIVVTEEPDSSGGIIKNITAVDLGNDTVDAAHLLQGYTAHNRLGQSVEGAYVPQTATLQAKTNIDPSTSSQTIEPDSGYDGLSSVQINAMPTGTAGTPTAAKGTVSNHSITVTPSVTNATGYITGGTKSGTGVTVSASELVSGSQTVTSNDTYDVTNLASMIVNVPSGGASNFVQGTFTTQSSAGAQSVTIPYTGSGYPIMAYVVVNGGAYNSAISTWYSSTQRYAVGVWSMSKSVMTSAPSYTTSGTQNQGVTVAIYKNSTSSSTSYTRSSAMNTNAFSSSNASNAAATCVRFKSAKSMSVYVNTSSYGLMPNLEYEYFIVYSS